MMKWPRMSPAPRPLILIIEDDPQSGEALALILSDWGAEVLRCENGDTVDARMQGRWGELACIITDFHLGNGPDGITLVQRLSQLAPHARVLVLSGSFHGRATAVAARSGLEVMQKPARAEAIVAWLERP